MNGEGVAAQVGWMLRMESRVLVILYGLWMPWSPQRYRWRTYARLAGAQVLPRQPGANEVWMYFAFNAPCCCKGNA